MPATSISRRAARHGGVSVALTSTRALGRRRRRLRVRGRRRSISRHRARRAAGWCCSCPNAREHEVLLTRRPRLSLTGWFRGREAARPARAERPAARCAGYVAGSTHGARPVRRHTVGLAGDARRAATCIIGTNIAEISYCVTLSRACVCRRSNFSRPFRSPRSSRASRRLRKSCSLTPSAVSHQIKALEEQLGVALFERGVRTLTLTDAGAHYLEHISDIFSQARVGDGAAADALRAQHHPAQRAAVLRARTALAAAGVVHAGARGDRHSHRDFLVGAQEPSARGGSVDRGGHGSVGRAHGARAVRAELHRGVLAGILARESDRDLSRT